MGTRVMFHQGAPNGALGHILSSPLPQFLTWFEEIMQEDPVEDGEVLLPVIRQIIDQGKAAFQVQSQEEARRIDRVADLFYSWFCDSSMISDSPLLIDAGGSMLYVSRFEDRNFIRKHLGPEAGRLWNFLLDGRGLGRPDDLYPYQSENGIFRVSYWTHEEVVYLRQCLEKFDPYSNPALWATYHAIKNVDADGLGMIITVA